MYSANEKLFSEFKISVNYEPSIEIILTGASQEAFCEIFSLGIALFLDLTYIPAKSTNSEVLQHKFKPCSKGSIWFIFVTSVKQKEPFVGKKTT